VWWCTSIIPTFGRLRQENLEFKDSLAYIARDPVSKEKIISKTKHKTMYKHLHHLHLQ
jgi:hypothetical protein